MISRKLMHAAVNRLQAIMSRMELAEMEGDSATRLLMFSKVKQDIRNLVDMLNSHVKEEKRPKK